MHFVARLLAPFAVLAALVPGAASAKDGQPHVTVAVGGAGCLCYLPTVLAKQLGEYE
jgi:NitT/TauT family transport system substrate-binding protein